MSKNTPSSIAEDFPQNILSSMESSPSAAVSVVTNESQMDTTPDSLVDRLNENISINNESMTPSSADTTMEMDSLENVVEATPTPTTKTTSLETSSSPTPTTTTAASSSSSMTTATTSSIPPTTTTVTTSVNVLKTPLPGKSSTVVAATSSEPIIGPILIGPATTSICDEMSKEKTIERKLLRRIEQNLQIILKYFETEEAANISNNSAGGGGDGDRASDIAIASVASIASTACDVTSKNITTIGSTSSSSSSSSSSNCSETQLPTTSSDVTAI